MPGATSSSADDGQADVDTWPWQCLDCEATIFHDGDFCQECGSAHRLAEQSRLHTPAGFLEWVRRESFPTFVLKVTAIAGTELALTALWLQMLLPMASELGRVAPMPI